MDHSRQRTVQEAGGYAISAPPYSRRAEVLQRRSTKVVERAHEVDVPIRYLGIAPMFAETRAYPGPTTDWVIGPVTGPDDAVVPKAERAALVRLVEAGIEFPLIYIAHEIPKGRLAIPDSNGEPSPQPTTVDHATAAAAVGPVPPPAAASALADQLGRSSQRLLRAMGMAMVGAGVIAATPFVLIGTAAAAVSALALDPIVFGVIPAGEPVPGQPATWYILTQWDWPTAPQPTP